MTVADVVACDLFLAYSTLFTWTSVDEICFFLCLVESNQKTSFQEIPKLNEDLVQKQKQLEQIETGELGLSKIWINITEINKQVRRIILSLNLLAEKKLGCLCN